MASIAMRYVQRLFKYERHRTTPLEKMALEATKPEAPKDFWVRSGRPRADAIRALPF